MLIKFEVQNFRSFNKRQLFHTLQRNFRRFSHHLYHYDTDLKLLKTSGIYGGNASGKTNLFKALLFVKKMVEDHDYLTSLNARNTLSPFRLDKESEQKDSVFKVDFIAKNNIYNYELSVKKKSNRVSFECLTLIENDKESVVFKRSTDSNNQTEFTFPINGNHQSLSQSISKIIPSSSTWLSLDLLPNPHLDAARDWFKNKLKFLFPVYEFGDIAYILSKKSEYIDLANQIIRFSQTGINKLRIDSIPIDLYLGAENTNQINQISAILEDKKHHPFKDSKGNSCTAVRKDDDSIVVLKLTAIHLDNNGAEVDFDLDQESRGTIVLLNLLPALILSYGEGVNYFIDEIGASLHPVLLREILAQYLEFNIEKAKGQLIFNSHEDFIMDERIIRQDELWLVEKSDSGETTIFPLSDIPNVRFDLNLRKNYLNGRFGGVPFDKKPGELKFDVGNKE